VRRAADRVRADVIIERYYNFGGEGIQAARATGALGVLEVNAPIIDYPGSPKAWLDRALVVEPMRRWRDRQCRLADLLVTPTAAIVPGFVPADRVVEIEWGADTDRFTPDAAGAVPFERRPGHTLAVFAGAFRAWHGAVGLVRAIKVLRERGRRDIDAVLIGDRPELPPARDEAAGVERLTFTGALAAALARLADRPDDRRRFGAAARDRAVREFSWAAHCRRLDECLREAAGRRSRS
jgi:glycosyltransferase involved in cell wall biosynthesis